MDTVYMTHSFWGVWYAACVLQVEAVPEQRPRMILPAMLSACQMANVSLECLCNADTEQAHQTSVRLILRKNGEDPHCLTNELSAVAETLLAQCGQEGIQATLLEKSKCYSLSQAMKAQRHLFLCFPGENLRRVADHYLPGGLDAVPPLDIPSLFRVFAEGKQCGISVMMKPTRLSVREAEATDALLRKLRQEGAGAATDERLFAALTDKKNQPLFFSTLVLWGEATELNQLLAQMRLLRFSIMEIPGGLMQETDYLGPGEERTAEFAAARGHVRVHGLTVPAGMERLSFLASAGQLTALLTARWGDAPLAGLPVNSLPENNVLIPPALSQPDGVRIGVSADQQHQPACLPLDHFSRHAVIVGMPGTGKTTFSFGLLYSMNAHKIPFLIVEPTKTEYRELMDVIPEMRVYTPGRADIAPLMFNPFLPPAGITLEHYLPSLETAFMTAFSMTRPLDVIFPEVLRNCYARYGWRMSSTRESPQAKPFGMQEFIRVFRDEAAHSGYDAESKANLETGGVYRFQSLINSNPILFDTDQPLPTDELLKKPILIELDTIDSQEQKALFLSLLLIQLKLIIRRDQAADSRLKNVIMIDEAHILLSTDSKRIEAREADPTGKAVTFLQDMVLVNRAYGTGMIFADQSPYKLTKEIISNADIQVVFRLNSADDRQILGNNMNMKPAVVRAIDALRTGQCYLYCSGLKAPVRLTTPNTREELKLRHQVQDREVRERMKDTARKPFLACPCADGCSMAVRQEAEFIARSFCDQARNCFADREKLKAYLQDHLQPTLEKAAADYPEGKKLMGCARMMVMRRVMSQAECMASSGTGYN